LELIKEPLQINDHRPSISLSGFFDVPQFLWLAIDLKRLYGPPETLSAVTEDTGTPPTINELSKATRFQNCNFQKCELGVVV